MSEENESRILSRRRFGVVLAASGAGVPALLAQTPPQQPRRPGPPEIPPPTTSRRIHHEGPLDGRNVNRPKATAVSKNDVMVAGTVFPLSTYHESRNPPSTPPACIIPAL